VRNPLHKGRIKKRRSVSHELIGEKKDSITTVGRTASQESTKWWRRAIRRAEKLWLRKGRR
jgi:hypothetical protein